MADETQMESANTAELFPFGSLVVDSEATAIG